MSAPTVTLSPASNPTPGQTVTATVVRDIPAQVVGLQITEADGAVGQATAKTVEPYTVKDLSTTPHVWAVQSDDGTTVVLTTVA